MGLAPTWQRGRSSGNDLEFNWVSGLWVAAFILKTGFVLRGTYLMYLEIVLNGRVLGLGCDWAFSSGRLWRAFSLVMEACGHDYGRCKAMMMNKMAWVLAWLSLSCPNVDSSEAYWTYANIHDRQFQSSASVYLPTCISLGDIYILTCFIFQNYFQMRMYLEEFSCFEAIISCINIFGLLHINPQESRS